MNCLVLPTLILAGLAFVGGRRLWRRPACRGHRLWLVALGLLLALPGLLYLAYYTHGFDRAAWYYQWRALPGTELAASGLGCLAGIVSAGMAGTKLIGQWLVPFLLALAILLPHAKPVLLPLPAQQFQDRWQDGVCRQSTEASCGPASMATLLRAAGHEPSELAIARACFTYGGGTESWYMARYLRRQGLRVRIITDWQPGDALPVPAIAGVRIGNAGHFLPIMAASDATITTGDPLVGRQEWPKDQIAQRLSFTGFFLAIGE